MLYLTNTRITDANLARIKNMSNLIKLDIMANNRVTGSGLAGTTGLYSLGADYTADLSRFGMGDNRLLTGEVILSDVNDGYDVFEARRQVAGMAPDGRPVYDLPADGD